MYSTTSDSAGDSVSPQELDFELRQNADSDKVFPHTLPTSLPNFTVGNLSIPGRTSGGISGDGYDLFPVAGGQWGLLIADASGTGVQAARRVVKAESIARALLRETADPAKTLTRVNDALVTHMTPQSFVTLCCAVIDVETRQIVVASAGHPPALWFHAEVGLVRELCRRPGLMAGILPNQRYSVEKHTLLPGDSLAFYTDGLIESRCGNEQFGLSRLRHAFSAQDDLSAPEIATAMYNAAQVFSGDRPEDDIAILILKAT